MAILDTHKEVQKLLKENRKFHKEKKGENYPDENGFSEYYSFAQEDLDEILSGELTPLYATNIFDSLCRWYLANTVYEILEHDDQKKALEHYKRATAYAYLTVALFVSERKCENGGDGGLWCDRVTELISRSLITGWEEEYVRLNEWIIESINYGRSDTPTGGVDALFFATGSELCKTSWFLLDLYCKAYSREYNMDNAEYTKNMTPYDKVIENWDNDNIEEVEKLVYILCEHHIMQTEEEKKEEDYFAFNGFDYELYPYEILSWLQLRENRGLNNPNKYTHPLMNTPIVKFFLGLERPLDKPKTLPYVKILVQEFKKVCPKLEVSKWLDGNNEQTLNNEDMLPEDFLDKN
jgi:hypothetical protein